MSNMGLHQESNVVLRFRWHAVTIPPRRRCHLSVTSRRAGTRSWRWCRHESMFFLFFISSHFHRNKHMRNLVKLIQKFVINQLGLTRHSSLICLAYDWRGHQNKRLSNTWPTLLLASDSTITSCVTMQQSLLRVEYEQIHVPYTVRTTNALRKRERERMRAVGIYKESHKQFLFLARRYSKNTRSCTSFGLPPSISSTGSTLRNHLTCKVQRKKGVGGT